MAGIKASFYKQLLHHLANYEGINDDSMVSNQWEHNKGEVYTAEKPDRVNQVPTSWDVL